MGNSGDVPHFACEASRSDPFGLGFAEAFGNSLGDSVSFRFPSKPSLDGPPLLPADCAQSVMTSLCSEGGEVKGRCCGRI